MSFVIDPLIPDVWAGDLHGNLKLQALIKAGPPWHGISFKATQSTYYPGPDCYPAHRAWFTHYFPLAKQLAVASGRYGVDFWRQAYHYMSFRTDPVVQAHWFLQLVEEAGGFDVGDLWTMLDAEAGGNPERPGKAKIEDYCSKFCEVIEGATGRKVVLYGNIYLAENQVNFKNTGCYKLVVARYTRTLPSEIYTRIGATLDDMLGWQYAGTEANDVVTSLLARYPATTPMGNADITAVIAENGGEAALQWLRDELNPRLCHA